MYFIGNFKWISFVDLVSTHVEIEPSLPVSALMVPVLRESLPVLMVLVQHVPMVWLQCAGMDLLPIHQPFLPALMVCPGVRMVEEYLVLMEPASLDSWPVLWVNSQIVLTYLVPYFHLAPFTQIKIKSISSLSCAEMIS